MEPLIMFALLGGVLILMVIGFYCWLMMAEQTDPWANNDPWKNVDPYQDQKWSDIEYGDWDDIEAETKASKPQKSWRPKRKDKDKRKGQDLIKAAIRAPDTREGPIISNQATSQDADFVPAESRQLPKRQFNLLAPIKSIIPSRKAKRYPVAETTDKPNKQSPSHSATVKQRILEEVYEENQYPDSPPNRDESESNRKPRSKKQRRGYRHSREFSLTFKFVSKKQ